MVSRRQMLRSSVVVGLFSLLASLTGILVETSIASKLGLSQRSDTFYVAFTIPYIITNLVGATGQFSLVPFFSSLAARRSPEELWRGVSYAINIVFFGSCGLAMLGATAAPWIIRGIAPGFTTAETVAATSLCRWLFLIVVPAGLAEVFRSFLLSQGHFAIPSAAGLFRNLTVIAFVFIAFRRYGAHSIAMGYLAGWVFQFVVLAGQVLISFPVHYSLVLRGSSEAFRNLRGAGAAQMGAALGWQAVVIVERMIASFLPPGTLTALSYGLKIMSTLAELLAGSVGTAALPSLSRAAAHRSAVEVRSTFQHTLEITLALVSPVTVFCLLLARPIIRLVFERGNFTANATTLAATVFFYYSLSLTLYSLVRVLNFYLFARHQGVTFLRLSIVQYGLTILLDLLYVVGLGWGVIGIPLGMFTAMAILCVWVMGRNVAEIRDALDRTIGAFSAKSLLGATLAALAIWMLERGQAAPSTGWANVVYVGELCGAGGLVFVTTLAASGAIPVARLATIRHRVKDT
jgi:putative peptidoglycan lipid II flippase